MVGSVIPLAQTRRPLVTKDKILDAAESLFMEHGFEATSLRAITAAAGVNLAAVNYHFGSKEELFQAVLTRRLDPMNQERVDLLSRLEHDAGPAALPCERILSAMFVPALRLARDPERGGKDFLRLLGRAYADPAPFIRRFLADQYATMIARFKAAFGRALPDLPAKELSWRLHFIMGALSYTLAGTDALRSSPSSRPPRPGTTSCCCSASPRSCSQGCKRRCPRWRTPPGPSLPNQGRAADRDRPTPLRLHLRTEGASMLTLVWIVAVLGAALALAYVNASGLAFTAVIAVALGVAWYAHTIPGWLALALTVVFVLLAIPGNVPALRRRLVSDAVLAAFRKVLPPMSQTERDAIEAGTVWWDGELFSGRPTGASCWIPATRRSPRRSSGFSTRTSTNSARW